MKVEPTPRVRRSDKAAATRAAILAAARRAFAAHGYDGVGLRAIAAEAGVTAMMVGRYFGSKEGLFGEVVSDTMRDPVVLASENLGAADIPRAFARALVGITGRDTNPLDGFMILTRSSSSETAARIARDRIAQAHHATAAGAVGADHPSERAAIFLSFVAGFQGMRQMMGLSALAEADPVVLVELLTPVIAEILKPAARSQDICFGA
ncbi:TetR/AcrR family transcriptional regulator [Methylobacterium gnaphalii]|uniref:TetR family transcriptional regulator n=1 Tax=Methylobacterium gnaphalii TaxID=1010610 RepID=A0A512JSB7_9HYPH|nr:TetR/AcrR family transcriptional regulator [Methylobacterium gnaphalii]GEP12812.1 TetR family transcriptional regulator [Methylobacterium gnaphalii]GJD71416.1 HTH-type transcriptional regulator BetI [Methylobacterium gnaphalii]GLS50934.1 TetR family transcriptional regulator [Methylobacterium gnaphalii]